MITPPPPPPFSGATNESVAPTPPSPSYTPNQQTPPTPPNSNQNTPSATPPSPHGTIHLEYYGNWVLWECHFEIKANGVSLGKFKFKKPWTIDIPCPDGNMHLHATLMKMRSADIDLVVPPGQVIRVILDYNRAWGNIYFTPIPNNQL